jgi:hypothetical protein
VKVGARKRYGVDEIDAGGGGYGGGGEVGADGGIEGVPDGEGGSEPMDFGGGDHLIGRRRSGGKTPGHRNSGTIGAIRIIVTIVSRNFS